jgi:hypothetical protein
MDYCLYCGCGDDFSKDGACVHCGAPTYGRCLDYDHAYLHPVVTSEETSEYITIYNNLNSDAWRYVKDGEYFERMEK